MDSYQLIDCGSVVSCWMRGGAALIPDFIGHLEPVYGVATVLLVFIVYPRPDPQIQKHVHQRPLSEQVRPFWFCAFCPCDYSVKRIGTIDMMR